MATPELEKIEHPQIINLSQVKAETIQADLVRASQTAIKQLNAEEVDIQTSAVGSIQTKELHVQDSIIGAVTSSQTSLHDSCAGCISAETLSFNGVTAMVMANSMSNKDVNAIVVIGTDIQADNIHTGILISREIHGNITTTVDGRTALLAGLVGGIVTGLILLVGKLLFARKK